MNEITIEIHHNGIWHQAARYRRDRFLTYDIDYVVRFMDENHPMARVGLGFDISFEEHSRTGWPAFLFDMIPGGPARSAWLKQHGQVDRGDADTEWTLLCFAASYPPGNLRIASAVERFEMVVHPGFKRQEIIERNVDFIDYAEANGAIVAGASSVLGQAPKFLSMPDWDAVAENISCPGLSAVQIRALLRQDIDRVAVLPETLGRHGVDDAIIDRLTKRIADLVLSLKEISP